jgi:hypothetical protein
VIKLTHRIFLTFHIKLWRIQGTITSKCIFINFINGKEFKESGNSLKVLNYIKAGDSKALREVGENLSQSLKMINNKK